VGTGVLTAVGADALSVALRVCATQIVSLRR
jgi:hypothetical protein